MTINLGNYESTRVEVGCNLSVRDGDDLDDTFKRAVAFVEVRLEEQVKEVTGPKPKPSPSKPGQVLKTKRKL